MEAFFIHHVAVFLTANIVVIRVLQTPTGVSKVCPVRQSVQVLEEDYSTKAFLALFTRLISRHGHFLLMQSDRGKNIVGADKQLCNIFSKASAQMVTIIPSLATLGTQWVFDPRQAPHFAGV